MSDERSEEALFRTKPGKDGDVDFDRKTLRALVLVVADLSGVQPPPAGVLRAKDELSFARCQLLIALSIISSRVHL